MNIGKAIKICRERRNLTQIELARQANLSRSYISLLEKNKREANVTVLENIANTLGIPLPLLIFLATEQPDRSSLPADLTNRLSSYICELIDDGKKS